MTRIITNWHDLPGTQHVNDIATFEYLPTDVLWICDTISIDLLEKINSKSTVPEFIVGDNAASFMHDEFKIYTTPFRSLDIEFLLFDHLTFNSDIDTRYCFNFMINKKQINRYLLIKLVEYFKLDSFDYTWSGIGKNFDMAQVINEWQAVDPECKQFSSELRSNMLSSITLPKRFFDFKPSAFVTDVAVTEYGGNLWAWERVFSQLMRNSSVALISESTQFQKSSVFTEKTLYPIMALNFPLYIGGYGNADQLTRMGFDVFDDVINHSYQYKNTLFERCYCAFRDNLELLSNLPLATALRKQHLTRLLNNRALLYQGQLAVAVESEVATWPDSLQTIIYPVWQNYKNYCKKVAEKSK